MSVCVFVVGRGSGSGSALHLPGRSRSARVQGGGKEWPRVGSGIRQN